MLACDDVYHARYGVRTVQRRRGTLHYLYLLDIVRVNQLQVILAAHIAMQALAIHQHKDIVVSQSVQLHLRTHIPLVEGE